MHVSSSTSTPGRARSGVPLLALAGVLWGTGGLLGQALAGATGLSAVAVAGYRLAGGGLLLCALGLLVRRALPRSRAAWWRVAVIGVLAALFQCGYFAAVATTSVSLATLVTIGSSPIAVLVVERVARLRPIGPRAVLGVGAAVAGLVLLVGPSGELGPGLLAAAAAGCAFALMTVLQARPVADLDASATVGPAFVVGGALVLPVAALLPGGLAFAPTPGALILLAAFAVAPTALAYTAYFAGLRTAPAGVGAVLALLEPVTAAVLAALLLGDRIGITGWIGAAVLCGAVLVTATDRTSYRTAPVRTA
ncbi:drug/metabolite transporter, DME family [Pseudonocardia thermophila]|uniref:Drug/metabolite transporter, DME family n=1 Tax=Pseudonocardia thermophila TaxID=1848 RepID=A0A1M6WCM5_PSETH|nr:DMT family transporter [Pseudonocardia thermophila]SHK91510.1 drug/metabolite transporter, DME family [Pseudonocardia thermophila]